MLRFYLLIFCLASLIFSAQIYAAQPESANLEALHKAQYELDHLRQKGTGAVQSVQNGLRWITHTVKQGFINIQYYFRSPSNVKKTTKWFKKASQQKDIRAQFNLAVAYKLGKGVKQSDAKAFQWFQKAAHQGYAPAQYHLGVQHYAGLGTPKDLNKGKKWLKLAAAQQFKPAEKALRLLSS